MTKFTWNYGPLEGENVEGLGAVVKVIWCECTATRGDESGSRRFRVYLGEPDPNNFMPLEDVDQATREAWVDEKEPGRRASVEAELEGELDALSVRFTAP